MDLRVHYFSDLGADAVQLLRSQLEPGINLSTGSQIPLHPDFQILINGTPDRAYLEASSDLNTLIIPYAGVPVKTRTLLSDFPQLKVYNLHHNAGPTAEMAVALLLAAAKFLVPFDRAFREHDWTLRYQPNPSILLEGKTALILGFGHIGQRVGRLCHALGMEVIAIRRNPDSPLMAGLEAEVLPPEALHQILPRIQVLIITLPFTDSTAGLVGAKELSLMVPAGILVNVGRGDIVDQEALYQALKHGTLGSTGLDVWYNYPEDADQRHNTPPSDFPFHELDNIVMSPHRGGGSKETETLRMHHLAKLLNALLNEDHVPNQVDLRQGY